MVMSILSSLLFDNCHAICQTIRLWHVQKIATSDSHTYNMRQCLSHDNCDNQHQNIY